MENHKLYIRENLVNFTGQNKFAVLDQAGRDAYFVHSKPFSTTIYINDLEDENVAIVFRDWKSFSFDITAPMHLKWPVRYFNRYKLKIGSTLYASVTQRSIFSRLMGKQFKVDLEQAKLSISGNIATRSFKLKYEDHVVGVIHKKLMSFGDSYELHVLNGDHEIELLMVGLTLIVEVFT